MPELPEVETIVREMRASSLEGSTIDKAIVYWHRSIAIPNYLDFPQQIEQQTIRSISRRGKFLVFSLSQDTLLVHLRMTGKFILSSQHSPAVTPHERVRLYLKDGRVLRYEDQRKFGKWYLVSDPQERLGDMGIEPLSTEFTLEAFTALLNRYKRGIKSFLLNQKYVAGLGNIYVDEALWQAKIHPLRPANQLSIAEIKLLHQAIIEVLQSGVDNLGTSLGAKRANYSSVSGKQGRNQHKLNVFRRNGHPCPRCHTTILKIVVAQRGTHLCPYCQLLNK